MDSESLLSAGEATEAEKVRARAAKRRLVNSVLTVFDIWLFWLWVCAAERFLR